jgi:hypothetical protein
MKNKGQKWFLPAFLAIAVLAVAGCSCANKNVGKSSVDNVADEDAFVRVSEDNPRYFCLSNGNTYIPVGCNLAALWNTELMEHYMEELHRNGGNFARVWLNSDFFEIEKEYGQWNEESIAHIDHLLELAGKYGIRIKMCIESFRKILPGKNKWDTKASYHISNGGPFQDMQEYISSEQGRQEYLKRLSFLQNRYGDDPAVFGWELWNEMNAVEAGGIEKWNVEMLDTVHKMFPKNMVMQSLGSLDRESSFPVYEFINKLESNDVMQVHRYIDQGAELPICSASIDQLSEDAVKHMLAYGENKPVLLAECGAVMPSHSGPHVIYKKDFEGIVLHDFLFAPFFCGAAGPGHLWHWDHYIDKVDVWFQIGRFSNAIKGIDPIAENFTPVTNHREGLRVYTLNGEKHIISWCRDTESTWQSELVNGIPAKELAGMSVDLGGTVNGRHIDKVEIYDPWNDKWTELAPYANVRLLPFKRSVIIKITLNY